MRSSFHPELFFLSPKIQISLVLLLNRSQSRFIIKTLRWDLSHKCPRTEVRPIFGTILKLNKKSGTFWNETSKEKYILGHSNSNENKIDLFILHYFWRISLFIWDKKKLYIQMTIGRYIKLRSIWCSKLDSSKCIVLNQDWSNTDLRDSFPCIRKRCLHNKWKKSWPVYGNSPS